MRILLFGGTGNLGHHLIASFLSRGHTLTVYVRNPEKLSTLITPALLASIENIVVGDALDVEAIKKALVEYRIECVVSAAGNQVWPWKEYLMPQLAKAICTATVEVGKERGRPLRCWMCTGLGALRAPGREVLMNRIPPLIFAAQHRLAEEVITSIPTTDLAWTMFCVGWMKSSVGPTDVLSSPREHGLKIQADVALGWDSSWPLNLPWFLFSIYFWGVQSWQYTTTLEYVADAWAAELDDKDGVRIGRRLGYIEKRKVKNA